MANEFMFNLSVLLLKEGKSWVAQCLEFDITAQGKTPKDAKKTFENTLLGQFILDVEQGKKPLEGIPQTPKIYFDLIERVKPRQQERKSIYVPQSIPSVRAASANYLQMAGAA